MEMTIINERTIKFDSVTRADIPFHNFAGKATDYNDEGNRNFNLSLSDEQANALKTMGIGVPEPKIKEDGTFWDPMVKINIKYNHYPDRMNPTNIITSGPSITRYFAGGGSVEINENTVKELDTDQYESMAFLVTTYLSPRSRTGLKTLYLRELRYLIEPNPLDGIYD